MTSLEIASVQLHHLKGTSTLLYCGLLSISLQANTSAPVLLMTIGSYTFSTAHEGYFKLSYTLSTTFLWRESGEVYAISIPTQNNERLCNDLENMFRQYSFVTPVTYEMQNSEQWIRESCPGITALPLYEEQSTLRKATTQFGSLVGVVDSIFKAPAKKMEQVYQTESVRISNQVFSQETKSKWMRLKEKASALNDTLSEMVKPVASKASTLTSSIKDTFEQSDNTVISSIRNISQTVGNSINRGFKEGKGPETQNQQSPLVDTDDSTRARQRREPLL